MRNQRPKIRRRIKLRNKEKNNIANNFPKKPPLSRIMKKTINNHNSP